MSLMSSVVALKKRAKPQVLPTSPWFIYDSAALERLALSGAGRGLLPIIEGERLVKRDELVRVLPKYEQEGAIASLIWPASRHLAPRVRSFIDYTAPMMADVTN